MALTPTGIYQALFSCRAIFSGPNFDRLALGLSTGITAWAIGQPQNLALSGTAVGIAGAGIINPATTRLIVPPTVDES